MCIVNRFPSWTASSEVTRPLMAADPMLRAPSPEIVSESTFTVVDGFGGGTDLKSVLPFLSGVFDKSSVIAGWSFGGGDPGARNRLSSSGTLVSTLSKVIFAFSGLPFTLVSIECGQ